MNFRAFVTLTFIVLCMLSFTAHAKKSGKALIDSFLSALPKAKEDTNKVRLLGNLSFAYDNVDPEKGVAYGTMCLKLAEKLNWKKGIAIANNSLGNNYINFPDFENAYRCFTNELAIHRELNNKSGIETDYYLLATLYYYQSAYDTGIAYAKQALKMAEELRNDQFIANALNLVAAILRSKGDLKLAIAYQLRALELNIKTGNQNGIALVKTTLASSYQTMGDLPKALEYNYAALKIFEDLGNDVHSANTLSNIAEIYASKRDYVKAEQFARKAMALSTKVGDKSSLIASYGNLQFIYNDQGMYEKGLEYLFKSLRLSDEVGLLDHVASDLADISITYTYMKRFREAISYGNEALKRSKEIGDARIIAVSLMGLGHAYLELAEDTARYGTAPILNTNVPETVEFPVAKVAIPQDKAGKIKVANYFLEQARDSAIKLEAPDLLEKTFQCLSRTASLQGKHKEALDFYKDYVKLHDSMYNKEKEDEITRHELQYQYQKREDSIRVRTNADLQIQQYKLQRQRTVIVATIIGFIFIIAGIVFYQRTRAAKAKAEQEALFSRQLLETELKALRAQMNPHFIFNCLNSIQSFILKENRMEATDYLQKFSRLIRLILDNSQKTANTIADETEILTLYLDLEKLRLKNKFDYDILQTGDIDPDFTEIPSMVIQPIVENSIWHGLSHSGAHGILKIHFNKEQDKLVCTVEDNGIGIRSSKEMKESSGLKHTSKGMRLIEDRLKAWSQTNGLNYQFEVTDSNIFATGTKTVITILYNTHA